MDEYDQKLIDRAKKLYYEDWNGVYALIKDAESEEARKELERIARNYYHNEEYNNGDL